MTIGVEKMALKETDYKTLLINYHKQLMEVRKEMIKAEKNPSTSASVFSNAASTFGRVVFEFDFANKDVLRD
jgi:hypothetical protein